MRCTNYQGNVRCEREATAMLFSPDGKRVPGGRYCRGHLEGAIIEYQEKLGQEWYGESIDDFGDIIPLTPLLTANYCRHFREKADI